jgi:hypothetical protein
VTLQLALGTTTLRELAERRFWSEKERKEAASERTLQPVQSYHLIARDDRHRDHPDPALIRSIGHDFRVEDEAKPAIEANGAHAL